MTIDYQALNDTARQLRISIIRSVYAAKSGHPGGSLSAADIVTALYFYRMKIDPRQPEWDQRDKFILSKGHAAPVLYAALAERGFFPKEELLTLRQLGSRLQGHPDMNKVPGVELSTGSLGQGLSCAVGMAIADKVDDRQAGIFVLIGDGEIQEGIVWEAAMCAAHYKLDNLTAILDWNGLQIDGRNEDVISVTPIDEKFQSFGWHVIAVDGHDMAEITAALDADRITDKPTLILAKTVKGKGVSFMEGDPGWHGKAPNEEQARQAIKELGGTW